MWTCDLHVIFQKNKINKKWWVFLEEFKIFLYFHVVAADIECSIQVNIELKNRDNYLENIIGGLYLFLCPYLYITFWTIWFLSSSCYNSMYLHIVDATIRYYNIYCSVLYYSLSFVNRTILVLGTYIVYV